MKKFLRVLAKVALVSMVSFPAFASTVRTYNSPCKYIDANSKLQVDAQCSVTFSSILPNTAYYFLTFPNGATVNVEGTENGATANGISAEILASEGNVVVLTRQGEVFVFQNP